MTIAPRDIRSARVEAYSATVTRQRNPRAKMLESQRLYEEAVEELEEAQELLREVRSLLSTTLSISKAISLHDRIELYFIAIAKEDI